MDVSDDASVDQAIESIVGMTARLDVVVNNAGVAYWGPLEAFTLDQARDQFDTNVFGVLRVNRAVLLHMRRQGSGLLVQIGSIAGRVVVRTLCRTVHGDEVCPGGPHGVVSGRARSLRHRRRHHRAWDLPYPHFWPRGERF
ncbi:MAG TPA: SDR family NAD(P)-dependent oxidoreductase [Candidatus Dormibacteraeota bacterium]|nr:SDR family NAD(P)-dependent oxidoreductase [Candidatus Dormibacteraeota bacterium]